MVEFVKMNKLKKAFNTPKVDVGGYDKEAKPLVDVDLSYCTDDEKPRMISIVNRLAQSEAGKETLEIAAEAGYKFGFLDAGTNCFGCCFGGIDAIGLGPMATDDKLVSTLCHEARHAGQGVRMEGIPGRDELNVASIIKSSRAKEADAQAYAVKACYELHQQGDMGPLATFKEFYPPIYDAFETSIAKHGEMNNQVVTDVFKGWYDQTTTKQAYEDGYIIDPMHSALECFDKGPPYFAYSFAFDVPSATVVDKIGYTKEGNYLQGENPNFLEEEKFISIGARTKSDCQAFFKLREEKTKEAKDPTIDAMPTHKDAYARRTPEMGQKKSEKPSMDMGSTIDKWKALAAAKAKAGR